MSSEALQCVSISLADDLVDVPIRPPEVGPTGTSRMLDRPDEFYAGGLHPGAGLLDIGHPKPHDGSGGEEAVKVVFGAPHLHLGGVGEPQPDHVVFFSDHL